MGVTGLLAAGIATSALSTGTQISQSIGARKQQRRQQHLADLAAREAKLQERTEVESRNRARQRLAAGSGKSTILGGESQAEIGRSVLLGQ